MAKKQKSKNQKPIKKSGVSTLDDNGKPDTPPPTPPGKG